MATPADLISKATQQLRRRPQPSLNEVLTGGKVTPPLTAESKAGLSVQAQLAYQHSEALEALDTQQRKQVEAQRAADDALYARIVARRGRSVKI